VSEDGVDLIVRGSNGVLKDRTVSWDQLAVAGVAENDGHGEPSRALAGLWGRWMQYASPRLRSAASATRSLKQFAHQDEAVFDHMLPQPRLRFLLADEPGTGKTIMTGMYLVEARRRGLIPGPSMIVVPAHLVQKWQEGLEDFFGSLSTRLAPEVARDPRDLDPRVDVWITSLDLATHNSDVRRKAAGARASWSLAVFDEAHRLTPTSRYLAAAQELAARSHHLLLLTATPHRGKEHFFRGLCNLLDAELYPWAPEDDHYDDALKPSRLSFLRRMKEELRDIDGARLFPDRFAETVPVTLGELEFAAYERVMEYAEEWYGDNSTLALSIYGKRAASCCRLWRRHYGAVSRPCPVRRSSVVADWSRRRLRRDCGAIGCYRTGSRTRKTLHEPRRWSSVRQRGTNKVKSRRSRPCWLCSEIQSIMGAHQRNG
jgi:SNF2 family DNA or RNA helicase